MTPRTIRSVVLLLALAAFVACACMLPLIWDGGYQLSVSLIQQKAYYYLTRFHSGLLWQPMVALSKVTDNRMALVFAYGLPFLLAPALSVAVSWWFVKKDAPRLAVWAVCGAAVSLPGQAFVINDSVLQHALAWPVFLGALVRLSVAQRCVWLLLAGFQFSHQIGVIVLFCVAFAAWRNGTRGTFVASVVLLLLAVAKVVWISVPAWAGVYFDSYAAQEASLSSALFAFATGVFGLPLIGLVLLWLAAAKFSQTDADETRYWKWALGGLAAWIVWSLIPPFWASAINYRRWIIPLAVPFFWLALADARRTNTVTSRWRDRLGLAIAVTFFIVITAQSVAWRAQLGGLLSELRLSTKAVVSAKELPSLKGSQLDHWGITTTVMFMQGKAPAQYLAYDDESLAAISREPHQIPLWKPHLVSPEPGAEGWFDHRPLVKRMGE